MTEIQRVFIRFRGRTIGPLTPDKVRDMVRRGQVTRMHELSGDGLSWSKADEFGDFFPRAAPTSAMPGDMAASASSVPPGEGGMPMGDGGIAPTPNENATAQWYAHVNGEKQGPVSMDQMRLYAEAKILKKDSLVWKNGLDAWKPAAEAIPELFGGGATPAATVVSSSAGEEASVEPAGALGTEITKLHSLIMVFGVCLLLFGATVLIAQVVRLNQGGRKVKSDYYSASLRISLAGVAGLAGVMAVQAGTKLKAAAETSSGIATLKAVQALNQFWVLSSIAFMIWMGALILAMIAALATNVPITNVLV